MYDMLKNNYSADCLWYAELKNGLSFSYGHKSPTGYQGACALCPAEETEGSLRITEARRDNA